jgi:hypothetical protein
MYVLKDININKKTLINDINDKYVGSISHNNPNIWLLIALSLNKFEINAFIT